MTEYRTGDTKQSALKYCLTLGLFSAWFLRGSVSAEVITGAEGQTGLRTWEWREMGVMVQLVQRLPDQTRACFLGRGFSIEYADSIAKACVFQTIVRNDGEKPLVYDLDDWQIVHRGKRLPLQTRERWDEKWKTAGVSEAARIAFRWSLLATRQGFEPGDYNWGMTSFGLLPGASFDLTLVLTHNNNLITRNIPGIVCAADRTRN